MIYIWYIKLKVFRLKGEILNSANNSAITQNCIVLLGIIHIVYLSECHGLGEANEIKRWSKKKFRTRVFFKF